MDLIKTEAVKEEQITHDNQGGEDDPLAPINGLVSDEEQMKLIAESVISLCKQNENGVTNKTLDVVFRDVRPEFRAVVINKLLSQNKIEILTKGNQLLYKLCQSDKSDKIKNDEEKVVYSIIENAGNKGIWTRDIRFKCNISLIMLNKVLKQMESKKMIKSVKSVVASKKKLYMVFGLEPDVSITGGTWYSNQDFDWQFVDILTQQCLQILQDRKTLAARQDSNPLHVRNKSYVSLPELSNALGETKISKVPLSLKDVETLMETLVFDGRAESKLCIDDSQMEDNGKKMFKCYRLCHDQLGMIGNGMMRMPCGGCPVIRDCHVGGVISPATCIYLRQWLDF